MSGSPRSSASRATDSTWSARFTRTSGATFERTSTSTSPLRARSSVSTSGRLGSTWMYELRTNESILMRALSAPRRRYPGGQLGDGRRDRCRLVFREEMTTREQDGGLESQCVLDRMAAPVTKRRIVLAPDHLGGIRPGGEALVKEGLLGLCQLESAHDPQEGTTTVLPFEQREVGVNLGVSHGGAVGEAHVAKHPPPSGRAHQGEPGLADNADRDGMHWP